MTNVNSPFGLSTLGGPAPSAPTMATYPWLAVYNAAAMYFGDPVMVGADGYIVPWTAGSNVAQLVGIMRGAVYLSTADGRIKTNNFWPGSDVASGNFVQIIVDPIFRQPNSLFLVQATLTPFTQADVGNNCDVSMGTGNTTTGISGATLNRGTIAVTATLPFTIVGLYEQNLFGGAISGAGINGSDPTSNYNVVIVSSNSAGQVGI